MLNVHVLVTNVAFERVELADVYVLTFGRFKSNEAHFQIVLEQRSGVYTHLPMLAQNDLRCDRILNAFAGDIAHSHRHVGRR